MAGWSVLTVGGPVLALLALSSDFRSSLVRLQDQCGNKAELTHKGYRGICGISGIGTGYGGPYPDSISDCQENPG